jgi:MFS family permease
LARYVLAVLFGISFLNYADRFILPPVVPRIEAEFHLTDAQVGLLYTAFILVYALAAIPFGIWADRGQRRHVLVFGVGLWSLATAATGLARNYLDLFITRAVVGVGESSYFPAGTSLLGDVYKKEQRPRVMAIWQLGNVLGVAAGFALGGIIAGALGWRAAFYFTAIPGLIFTALALTLREPVRGAAEVVTSVHAPRPRLSDVRALLRNRTYILALIAQTLVFFVLGSDSFWLPTFLQRHFGLSSALAGILPGVVLVGAGFLGTMLGGLAATRLRRRYASANLLTAAAGFLLASVVVVPALVTTSLALFVGGFFITGAALYLYAGPLTALQQDVVMPHLRGSAIAVALLVSHVFGDAFAPLIVGRISDAVGQNLRLAVLLTTPALLCAAGLVALAGLRGVRRDVEAMERDWARAAAQTA